MQLASNPSGKHVLPGDAKPRPASAVATPLLRRKHCLRLQGQKYIHLDLRRPQDQDVTIDVKKKEATKLPKIDPIEEEERCRCKQRAGRRPAPAGTKTVPEPASASPAPS